MFDTRGATGQKQYNCHDQCCGTVADSEHISQKESFNTFPGSCVVHNRTLSLLSRHFCIVWRRGLLKWVRPSGGQLSCMLKPLRGLLRLTRPCMPWGRSSCMLQRAGWRATLAPGLPFKERLLAGAQLRVRMYTSWVAQWLTLLTGSVDIRVAIQGAMQILALSICLLCMLTLYAVRIDPPECLLHEHNCSCMHTQRLVLPKSTFSLCVIRSNEQALLRTGSWPVVKGEWSCCMASLPSATKYSLSHFIHTVYISSHTEMEMIRVLAVFSIIRLRTCSTWLSFLLPFSMSKLRRNVVIASPGFVLVYLLSPYCL